MEKQQIVLSSTHVDSHGMMMTKEALDNSAEMINSGRNPRLGLEHDMSFPPLGRITNAEVIQGKDGEYYLVAYQEYFDNRKQTTLEDGTVLYKEYFNEGGKPFTESKPEPKEKVEFKTDPVNFENRDSLEEFVDEIRQESNLDFDKELLLRKSVLPDPEIVIQVTSIIAVAIGVIKSKVTEKLGEAIGDDIANFYKFLRASAIGMIKRAIPKNKPITFVVEVHDEIIVELIIKSNNPDEVVSAFTYDTLSKIQEKIISSKNYFNAEKIQFSFNEEKSWELNYMLTKDGATIGTKKAFDRRDKAFSELVNKMIEKNDNNASS